MATVHTLQAAGPGEAAWSPPRALDGAPLPTFPVLSVLSDGQRWIDAVSHATQTPSDLSSMVLLGQLAAAVRGRAEIEVREGWREPLTLFTAVVLPSGEGKSPVMKRAVAPLRDVEVDMMNTSRSEVAQGQALYRVAEERLKIAERDAARSRGAGRYEDEEVVWQLADNLAGLDYPETPRILLDDATPEALVGVLVAHRECAVMSAEGGLLDTLAGRYAEGVANLDGVLKAWSGESIHVDRRGRASEFVERPILALCLAVQSQVMENLRDQGVMRGRGLTARFLYSLPKTLLGTRMLDPEPVPAAVEGAWSRVVRELARPSDKTDRTQPVLKLSMEAESVLTGFRRRLEPRLLPAAEDLFELSDWAGKLPGNVARIAGLLHLAEYGWAGAGRLVSGPAMEVAVGIGEYLIPHAQAAISEAARDSSRASAVLRWLRAGSVSEVSVRDVQRKLGGGGRFPDVVAVEGALRVLEDHGHLREMPQPAAGPQGGRSRSPRFEVHPDVHGGRSPLASGQLS